MDESLFHYKSMGLDLSPLLTPAASLNPDAGTYHTEFQDHELDAKIDNQILEDAMPALETGNPVQLRYNADNLSRTLGTMLSYEVST